MCIRDRFFIAVLAYAIVQAFAWPPTVRLFPLVFSIPALMMTAAALYYDWRLARLAPVNGIAGFQPSELNRTFNFFAWLTGVVILTVLFGQHVALPVFIAAYLLVWGRYDWKIALVYAAAGLTLMIVLFDYLSPTLWYPALVPRWWAG